MTSCPTVAGVYVGLGDQAPQHAVVRRPRECLGHRGQVRRVRKLLVSEGLGQRVHWFTIPAETSTRYLENKRFTTFSDVLGRAAGGWPIFLLTGSAHVGTARPRSS